MRAPAGAARTRMALGSLTVAVAAALLSLGGCGGGGDPGGGGPAGAGVGGEGASPSPSAGRRAPEPPAPGAGRALHAAPGTWVLDASGRVLARPRRMDFASDASLLDLRWRGWDGLSASASASGRVRLLRCHPDCADGTVFYRPARIRLTDLKRCGHARFYAVATVTYRKAGRSRPIADYIRPPC